jgi:hypothetical protein
MVVFLPFAVLLCLLGILLCKYSTEEVKIEKMVVALEEARRVKGQEKKKWI